MRHLRAHESEAAEGDPDSASCWLDNLGMRAAGQHTRVVLYWGNAGSTSGWATDIRETIAMIVSTC